MAAFRRSCERAIRAEFSRTPHVAHTVATLNIKSARCLLPTMLMKSVTRAACRRTASPQASAVQELESLESARVPWLFLALFASTCAGKVTAKEREGITAEGGTDTGIEAGTAQS